MSPEGSEQRERGEFHGEGGKRDEAERVREIDEKKLRVHREKGERDKREQRVRERG